jgi:hypothetical protein
MTMTRKVVPALALALLATAACNTDGSMTSDEGLAIEASISSASIGLTESATITYRLRNVSRLIRTVSARSGCDIGRLYIDNAQGVNVFPADHRIVCTLQLRPPDILSPGQETTRTFIVSGANVAGGFVKLPAGRYTAVTELVVGVHERRFYLLRMPEVEFEVK